MAYTVTRYKTVFGDKAVVGLVIDTDATTGTVETGLKNIQWITGPSPVSMNTLTGIKVAVNSNASGVQSFGVLGISGVSSGDRFHITVFGTR